MKSTVIKFGMYSSLILLILFSLQFIFEENIGYELSEIFGYASIVISLIFVYFAIKHFRDHENNGQVSLGKAIGIGLLVSLLASLTFGIINYVYVEVINPEFMTEYYSHQVEIYRSSLSETNFQEKLKELESQKEMFTNPVISSVVMALTVLIIGLIFSLISGLILQRKS
ncbi:DUF4199 domain-containing protein [Flavobacteriaceae bacterium LMO-SS05]